jgi:hypothetical protein
MATLSVHLPPWQEWKLPIVWSVNAPENRVMSFSMMLSVPNDFIFALRRLTEVLPRPTLSTVAADFDWQRVEINRSALHA